MSKERPLKSHCSGLCQKRLGSLLYVKELCRDLSIRVPSQWYQLVVENTCPNRLFWTGLRAKHDIIQGARDRLCKEQAHAI